MIITPFTLSFIFTMMKATTTFIWNANILYTLGRFGKIPRYAMHFVWSFSLGGCLFLAIGLFLNNYQLIKRWIIYHWHIGPYF